jgi:hypothetical protein
MAARPPEFVLMLFFCEKRRQFSARMHGCDAMVALWNEVWLKS